MSNLYREFERRNPSLAQRRISDSTIASSAAQEHLNNLRLNSSTAANSNEGFGPNIQYDQTTNVYHNYNNLYMKGENGSEKRT